MGIKHFFSWWKTNFHSTITPIKKNQQLDISIDHLMIDLNALFHTSTQKIYEYGLYKQRRNYLYGQPYPKKMGGMYTQMKVFEDICENINQLVLLVKPTKKLILCVDGVAPLSKQNQQRQRRFKSASEKDEEEFTKFDSNCLTPGTKFMHYLTKYIDWYIRKTITLEPHWKHLEVIFSNEKSPGEGEHKLINYMRLHHIKQDTYCLHGVDADLIMLSLGTHLPNFYILREALHDHKYEFYILNIGESRHKLIEILNWNTSTFNSILSINDFIFMCFMVGNDFLPHVPSLEIIEGGIDHMISVYKKIGSQFGHLIDKSNMFMNVSLQQFLLEISKYDKEILETKLLKKKKYFEDILLEQNAVYDKTTHKYILNIDKYRTDYYTKHFSDINIKQLCHDYLEGLQWVMSYYTKGVPNWKWCFKHHYAPFAFELANFVSDYIHTTYTISKPATNFEQLLSVLPSKSHRLLPSPLSHLLLNESSIIKKKYCPSTFIIDLSGKGREWEGIVLLPIVDFDIISAEYQKIYHKLSPHDLLLTIERPTHSYIYSPISYQFSSFYGNLSECNCRVSVTSI